MWPQSPNPQKHVPSEQQRRDAFKYGKPPLSLHEAFPFFYNNPQLKNTEEHRCQNCSKSPSQKQFPSEQERRDAFKYGKPALSLQEAFPFFYPRSKNKNIGLRDQYKCKICREIKEGKFLRQQGEYPEWYHVPVKVNVVVPLPIPPETEAELETKIGNMIALANSYLAQAGIALKYDVNTDLNFDRGGISALDGNLDIYDPITGMSAKTELDAMYSSCCDPSNPDAEIKIGRKIVIAAKLGNNYGYTVHPTEENGHLSKMLIINNDPNMTDLDIMGYTLAHEFCHSVTLGPDHKYTGGSDPSWGHADKEGHVEPGGAYSGLDEIYYSGFDHNDIKHWCNLMRETPCLELGGGKLTEEQKAEIRNYVKDPKNNVGEEKKGRDRRVNNTYKRRQRMRF